MQSIYEPLIGDIMLKINLDIFVTVYVSKFIVIIMYEVFFIYFKIIFLTYHAIF